jgi:hypothetical protein
MDGIPGKDRQILRELAKKQREYAEAPAMETLIEEWYAHNDMTGTVPPRVQVETGTFAGEAVTPLMRCESEAARAIEWRLVSGFVNHELFGDDTPVPGFFPIRWFTRFSLFDLSVETEHAFNSGGNNLGYRFKHPIKDLETDLPGLKPSVWGVDRAGTYAFKERLEEIFGDILPVQISGAGLYASITQDAVRLMGLENLMLAMYDCPDAVHGLMERISGDYAAFFEWQEREELLLPVNGFNPVAQGTWGFTHELKGGDKPVTAGDCWGYLDSQETSSLSPGMYGEFVFPYYKKVSNMYGLLSYACCEPVDAIWRDYLSACGNMRKVSVSGWCNEGLMGEYLQGKKIIYYRKPFPNYLGVDKIFDEGAFAAHIKATMEAARGCFVEFCIRDVYTVHKDIARVRKAVEIMKRLSRQ